MPPFHLGLKMKRKTKYGDEEKLDATNIEKVIKLLEPVDGSKAITKKDACAILNIAYNTIRLGTIIEKYKERKAADAKRRAALRGKPPTTGEIQYIISEYLRGEAIDSISKASYRGSAFIHHILEEYHVPIRARSQDYFKPILIPEEAVRDRFKNGEIVYSARYDSIAEIRDEVPHKDERVYRIWLLAEKWQQFAYQPASELASLEHLQQLGVKL